MNVEVIKNGKHHRFQVKQGSNLMDFLLKAGMMTGTECAGRGICGKCRVLVHSGEVPHAASDGASQLHHNTGYILACQSFVRGDLIVEVPPRRRPSTGRWAYTSSRKHMPSPMRL